MKGFLIAHKGYCNFKLVSNKKWKYLKKLSSWKRTYHLFFFDDSIIKKNLKMVSTELKNIGAEKLITCELRAICSKNNNMPNKKFSNQKINIFRAYKK